MVVRTMHGFRAKLDYLLKHNYFINRVFTSVISTIMRTWGLFLPIDERLVLFSGHSREYNDSPRALYEYMLAHYELYSGFRIVWDLESTDSVSLPGSPIIVKSDTISYFRYSLKAKYWITCVNIERGLHYKKKRCKYLNTWHGTPFKHVGNDAGKRKDYNFSNIDFFCYASEFEKQVYLRAFRTRENAMIPTGLPRNDELYHVTKDEIYAIKKKLSLPMDKKVILYAPTWRDSNDGGNTYTIAPPISINKWTSHLKDNYVVLFRTHAYTNKLLGISFNETIRDYSSYPVVNDLFKISDILISDYSAAMADYCILERPVLCFAYDYEQYLSERGLYLDYETEMPSGVLRTENEVLEYIDNMDYKEECNKTNHLLKERLIQYGGNATRMCLDYLFS